MSATRKPSLRVVRNLSQQYSQSLQTRSLHMTGPATSPTHLASTGSKSVPKPTPNPTSSTSNVAVTTTTTTFKSPPGPRTRHINTTRALKTPNDTSTIDFAFLPFIEPPRPRSSELTRVPLLHSNFSPPRTGAHAPEALEFDTNTVHRPVIATIAADSTHIAAPSPMAEVHDNNVMDAHIRSVAEAVNSVRDSVGEEKVEAERWVRRLWGGLLDDVFGKKTGSPGGAA